jgi:hypothetical protein
MKKIIILFLIAGSIVSCGKSNDSNFDPTCDVLLKEYITNYQAGGPNITAATQLLINRSRGSHSTFTPYWRKIFSLLKEQDRVNKDLDFIEDDYIRILGRLLYQDFFFENLKLNKKPLPVGEQEENLQIIFVTPDPLSKDVVDFLLKIAKKREDSKSVILIALVQAHDERCVDFLKEIIGRKEKDQSFIASIGLAEMGYREGWEWLIENIDKDNIGLTFLTHFQEKLSDMQKPGSGKEKLSYSGIAFQFLSGDPKVKTASEGRNWLKNQSMPLIPKKFISEKMDDTEYIGAESD